MDLQLECSLNEGSKYNLKMSTVSVFNNAG